MEIRENNHSFFWPVFLIGIGAIWLMSNLGYLDDTRLLQVWRLWPLLLIAGGLDMLLGRRIPLVGAIIGLLVVGAIAFFLVSGVQFPALAMNQPVTERYNLPVDDAKSANVSLDFWSDPVHVYTLSDSNQLIDANLTHTGQVLFNGSGQEVKNVSLGHSEMFNVGWFGNWRFNQKTDVGLSPEIPLNMDIKLGSGSSDLDLAGLEVSDLSIHSGSGMVKLMLPVKPIADTVDVQTGSGSLDLTIPPGVDANISLDTGSGAVRIDLPSDAAVRIDVQHRGSGSIHLPENLVWVSQGDHDTGIWETSGYDSATNQVEITLRDAGSGYVNFN